MKNKRRKRTFGQILSAVLLYTFIGLFAFMCFLPLYLVLSISLTDESSIKTIGYQLIPKQISFEAYRILFSDISVIGRSYAVTTFVTIVGTVLSLIVMSLMAYPMSRKDFKGRNFVAFFSFFTMLFNGGMVSFYIICTKMLHLQNSLAALILPGLASAWFIMLLRNFYMTIPESLYESAKLDGAGEYSILFRIILPLSKPSLATVGLFTMLGYWNEWFRALLFMTNDKYIPLQLLLVRLLNNIDFMRKNMDLQMLQMDFPSNAVRMATVVIVTGPIVLVYPLFQKYIVKGMLIGSVKG